MELFTKHKMVYTLSLGIVRSIPVLVSDRLSDNGAEAWAQTWREAAGKSSAFQMALRLTDAALAYRKNRDHKALLELPTEERSLLESLLKPDADSARATP